MGFSFITGIFELVIAYTIKTVGFLKIFRKSVSNLKRSGIGGTMISLGD